MHLVRDNPPVPESAHPATLREADSIVATSLSMISSCSLSHEAVPDNWKLEYTTKILK